jgi:hypothetical protein
MNAGALSEEVHTCELTVYHSNYDFLYPVHFTDINYSPEAVEVLQSSKYVNWLANVQDIPDLNTCDPFEQQDNPAPS